MKLSDIRDDYFTYSTRVSDIVRNLNYAGIALLWILSHEEKNTLFATHENILPLCFLVFSMLADVLQYLFQTIIWFVFYVHKKKELLQTGIDDVEDAVVHEKEKYNIIPWCFWALKILFTLIAFVLIAMMLLGNIRLFQGG